MKTKWLLSATSNGLKFTSDGAKMRFIGYAENHPKEIYDLIPREQKKKRTLPQNSYYFAYLRMIENETGNEANDLHEIFKRLFLQPRFVSYQGKEIKLPASTTGLTKLDMGDYLDKICAHTAVPLPDPADAGYFV